MKILMSVFVALVFIFSAAVLGYSIGRNDGYKQRRQAEIEFNVNQIKRSPHYKVWK